MTNERRLTLEGSYNIRDIGGYMAGEGQETRWGALLRADSPHRLAQPAVEHLRQMGLRTVIDLRRPDEIASAPNPWAQAAGITVHQISLAPVRNPNAAPPAALPEIYREILEGSQPQMAEVLQRLAEPDALPALVHCMAGKDRTGLVIALLLALVGVASETIIADYALSAHYLGDGYVAEARQRAATVGVDWDRYQRFLICPPHYMQDTLDYVSLHYGGSIGYLNAIGVDATTQITICRALLQSRK